MGITVFDSTPLRDHRPGVPNLRPAGRLHVGGPLHPEIVDPTSGERLPDGRLQAVLTRPTRRRWMVRYRTRVGRGLTATVRLRSTSARISKILAGPTTC